MAKERAQFFTAAEQELLLEGYAEFETLIKTPGNTSKCANARKEGWQKVADKLNANQEKGGAEKKTGGGPAHPHYTPAEELALGLNVNRPIVEGIPGSTSSLDQNPGTSNSNTFITVLHNTPTLLPVPNKVVAEICADSEETLSDDCPLEEVLVRA
ncbi:hypothetical protein DPX16_12491 [Anabarilius grahami]|uniref:Uncharacterized protein n=1 Tax=Anabarilius grahami TaxID=495550 RepID=A0A3N0Y0A4_ANAGA|nr:hypothetical protein DPX16_12491 [Anabarilius grahami]